MGTPGVGANAGASQGGGFWRGVGNFFKDMFGDEAAGIWGGPIIGNIGGILRGLGGMAWGAVTGNGALFKASAWNLFGSAVMLRSGPTNGLAHPAPGAIQTRAPSTPNHRAAVNHDRNVSPANGGFLQSAPHFQYVRDAWSGPGQFMGPWGQAYRIYATVGLGIAGAGLWVAGQ